IVKGVSLAAATSEAASRNRVDSPDGTMLCGLNVAVTPLGRPVALRVTLSWKPFRAAMLIVIWAWPPGDRNCELGETTSVKSGVGVGVDVGVGARAAVRSPRTSIPPMRTAGMPKLLITPAFAILNL